MNIQIYQVMHVLSAILLTAVTFQAFAAPTPERRKRTLMFSGILSVLVLIGGFGLMAKLGLKFGDNHWLFVKITSWLVVSAMAGIAFRAPGKIRLLSLVTIIAVAAAVYTVYVGRQVG